jgi:hypothetical protein
LQANWNVKSRQNDDVEGDDGADEKKEKKKRKRKEKKELKSRSRSISPDDPEYDEGDYRTGSPEEDTQDALAAAGLLEESDEDEAAVRPNFIKLSRDCF